MLLDADSALEMHDSSDQVANYHNSSLALHHMAQQDI